MTKRKGLPQIAYWADPLHRVAQSELVKRSMNRPSTKARASAAAKARWIRIRARAKVEAK
jgi:hypothetical protein